jgi:hypothetical protein
MAGCYALFRWGLTANVAPSVLVQRELENSNLKISNILNKKEVLRVFILLGF